MLCWEDQTGQAQQHTSPDAHHVHSHTLIYTWEPWLNAFPKEERDRRQKTNKERERGKNMQKREREKSNKQKKERKKEKKERKKARKQEERKKEIGTANFNRERNATRKRRLCRIRVSSPKQSALKVLKLLTSSDHILPRLSWRRPRSKAKQVARKFYATQPRGGMPVTGWNES